jgi:hypothetical protein
MKIINITKTIVFSLFFCFLLCSPHVSYAEPVKGWYDSENDWFIYEWEREGEGTVHAIHDVTNKVDPVITSDVSYSPSSEKFKYTYTVTNSSGKQLLYRVSVEYMNSISDSKAPSDEWYTMPNYRKSNAIRWSKSKAKVKHGIDIGETEKGFSFNSDAPPMISNSSFFGRKRIEITIPGDYDSVEVAQSYDRVMKHLLSQHPDKFEDVKRKTVAPGPIPDLTDTLAFIDNIVSLKHEAADLGWITNQGIVLSLDQKLEAARKKLEQGNTKAAKNILNAFIKEVEAQGCESYESKCPKGKHILPEAYALLKYNAKYLVDNLE